MEEAFKEYMVWIIVFGMILVVWIFVLVTLIIAFKIRKVAKVMELDKAYKKYNSDVRIIEETRTRNIWDYNFFPGMSKLWHFSGWQFLVAMGILLFLLLLYGVTKEDRLFNLLGVNFGILLGMMIKK